MASVTGENLGMDDDLLASLRFLIGRWRGEGRGEYPTVSDFSYIEECRFTKAAMPFLAYTQATRDPATGEAMHVETGYWRPGGPGLIEATIVHANGWVEVAAGTVANNVIDVHSTALVGTPTAEDEVAALNRRIEVNGDTLRYTVDMAACGHPLLRHLEATLHRA
jgi:THAP4-like, heme-binding beta-barrel domain